MTLPTPLSNSGNSEVRDMIRVRSITELDWFVKESELVTAQRGREFVVVGADRWRFAFTSNAAG